jgi:hypothetical protein
LVAVDWMINGEDQVERRQIDNRADGREPIADG